MFGIGKKKETVDKAAKVEKKEIGTESETEKEIQFDFEENDKLPFDDEEGFTDEGFSDEDFAEEAPRKGLRQALSQRTLLLVLLLLVIGGGGYYFLSTTPVPPPEPPQPAPAVKAKVVVQPAAPAPAVAVKPASTTPVAAAPAKVQQPATPAPAAAVKPASAAPVAAAPVKSPQPAVAAAAPAAKGEAATSATPSTPVKPFTLSAGTFISQSNLRAIEKKIRGLGYTPKVQSTYSMVPMTRLLLGVYDDPAAAQARSRELSSLVPDIFSLKQGESVALYAGSYQGIDEARRFADQLYKQGILVDEETVTLRMAVKKVNYGSFASRAAAEKAAKRAATVGLTAQVVKR